MYLYDCVNFRCDFDPEDSNPFYFFCTTLHLTTMHHHTKFGYKKLSSSERIFWTKPRHTARWTDRHCNSSTPSHFDTGGIKSKTIIIKKMTVFTIHTELSFITSPVKSNKLSIPTQSCPLCPHLNHTTIQLLMLTMKYKTKMTIFGEELC